MTRIRAALFDLDGTLYHQPPVRACMAIEMALHFIASGSPRALKRHADTLLTFRKVREELRVAGASTVSLADEQFNETARRTGINAATVRALFDEWMDQRPLKYLHCARRRNVTRLLDVLAGHGIRLGVLSDYPAERKLRALGLADAFTLTLCTTDPEINAFKPHPRGLFRACELWGLTPRDVVYVGDRADVDLAAAEAAGMRGYLVSVASTSAFNRNDLDNGQKDGQHGIRGLEELQRDARTAA